METNLKPVAPHVRDNGLKFNVSSCLCYIDGIEDFTIEFESKPRYDDISETMMYVAESIEVKSFLRTFIMKCKKESLQEEYDFVKWLRGRRSHWKVQQYLVQGCLNERLQVSMADDKTVLEKKLRRYLDFFRHNCKLIEMMLDDVMNNFSQIVGNGRADTNSAHSELPETIESFDRLFKKGRDAKPYWQLLRENEYPLIGNEYNYISKALKSGFCIWIYELQSQHIISHQPDTVYAKLLLKRIDGLKVFDASVFRKTNNKAESRYKQYFTKKVGEVKQAQDAQAARL